MQDSPHRSQMSLNAALWALGVVLGLALLVLGMIYLAGLLVTRAPTDEAALDRKIQPLQQRVSEAIGRGSVGPALMRETIDFAQRHPDHAGAQILLGQAYTSRGDNAEALAAFGRALRLDPEAPEVHLLAGTLALKLGRDDRAREHYAKAVELNPESIRSLLHLATVETRWGELDMARALIDQVLAIDADAHEALAVLARVERTAGNLDQALAHVRRAIELVPVAEYPARVRYVRMRASLLRQAGQPEQALWALRSLAEADPSAELLEEMALCLGDLGMHADAAQLFEEALRDDPNNAALAAGAARWRLRAGDPTLAAVHLDRLRMIDPESPELQELSRLLAAQQSSEQPPGD